MRWLRNQSPVMLYILHSGNLYGTERMALATLEGMNEYHLRVVLAPAAGGSASVADAARQSGFESVTFGSRFSLLKSLWPWFLRYRSIDVIGTGVVHSILCHALSRLLGVRLRQLHVAHGGTPHSFDRKQTLNRIPVVLVAVSNFVKTQLIQHDVHADRIVVIDNFLSDAQRRQFIKREPYDPSHVGFREIRQERVRVAVVSRVDTIKRIDLLVAAVESYQLREFEFDVYGTGEELDQLRERSTLLPNIRFHGFVSDVKNRLTHADVLLHLCPEEPFGLVVLEAYLAGLVVIVPDAGGAASLVQDGETGLHFKSNDLQALCEALRKIQIMSGFELQRIATAGRLTLSGRFAQAEGVRRYQRALVEAGAMPKREGRRPPPNE